MTVLRVNTLSGIGTGGPVFDGKLEFNSQNYVILPKGTTSDRVGVGSTPGALRYNTDSNKVELYDGSQWTEVQASRSDLNGGARGLFGIGYLAPSNRNVIDYITISSTGNSQDFGDLLTLTRQRCGCSSSTRGLIAGGYTGPGYINTIEYVTLSSTGNSISFGSLTVARGGSCGSCANATRGVFAGGYIDTPITNYNIIDYVTIASTGNAVDFGDLSTSAGKQVVGGLSNSTRGIFGGGTGPAIVNVIEFITIATIGNSTDFGDLTVARKTKGCSNATRGVFGGGYTPSANNTIDYITIASLGNAVDFGDMLTAADNTGSCASSTRGVWAGGDTPGGVTNVIQYISIATQGNAIDFGDLSQNAGQVVGLSNAHGGL